MHPFSGNNSYRSYKHSRDALYSAARWLMLNRALLRHVVFASPPDQPRCNIIGLENLRSSTYSTSR